MAENSRKDAIVLPPQWCRRQGYAPEELNSLGYDEFHDLAHPYSLGEKVCHTLQALLKEASIQLIDFARSPGSLKRGGNGWNIEFDDARIFSPRKTADVVAVDAPLNALAAFHQSEAPLVEPGFSGGLNSATSEVRGLFIHKMKRDRAPAWLARELKLGGQA